MIQSHEACKAEFAVHKIWENLRLLEDHGICGEAEEALANNSDTSVALTREIMETAKRSFYTIWKAIDPKGYSEATRMEDETWSGRSLPDDLPRLRPRKWQRVAKRLKGELPSDERLEHWNERLFWVGFSTIMSEPGYKSFALNSQWDLAQVLLSQLRVLADLARRCEMRSATVYPLCDVAPNVPFVFRRDQETVAIRAFEREHCFRFRREPCGFRYLQLLLKNPGSELTLTDIQGVPPISQEERDICLESLWARTFDRDDGEISATQPQEGFSLQTLADPQSLRAVAERISDLREEQEKARKGADLASQDRISKELDGLLKYIEEGSNPSTGHLRAFQSSQNRAVRRDLLRVYEKLEEKGLRKLASHFHRHVQLNGCRLVYRPPEGIHWHS